MGAKSSRRFHPHIGFSRIILGVYSGSISHKVVHRHRHTRAQRIMLSHVGTAHLPKSGAHRHRRPHTKRLAFTHKHLEMPTPPEHIGVGYLCGDVYMGTQGHTVACHEPHSTHMTRCCQTHRTMECRADPQTLGEKHIAHARINTVRHPETYTRAWVHPHPPSDTGEHVHILAHSQAQRYTHTWQCLGTYLVITLGGEFATGI